MIYECYVKWGKNCICTFSNISLEDSQRKALTSLLGSDYTTPKWWQFWRGGDTDISKWKLYKEINLNFK